MTWSKWQGDSWQQQSFAGWQTASTEWACYLCQQSNQAKAKACKNCNARRTFADAALKVSGCGVNNVGGQPKQPNHVTQLIHQATNMAQSGIGHTVCPAMSNPSEDLNRKVLEDKIRTLEGMLRSLPENAMFGNVREQITTDIAETKVKINAAKPVGLRLEECRQALTRAEERNAQADQCLKAAVDAKEAAQKEVERLKREIANIELEVRSSKGVDSLTFLKDGMAKVLQEMSASTAVSSDTVQNASCQMDKLFKDLATLAASCQQHMDHQAATHQQAAAQQLNSQQQSMQQMQQQQMWQHQMQQHQQQQQQHLVEHQYAQMAGLPQVPSTPVRTGQGSPVQTGFVPIPIMVPSVAQQLQFGVHAARALGPQFNAAASGLAGPESAAVEAIQRSRSPVKASPNGEGGATHA